MDDMWTNWMLDQKINNNGIPVDKTLVADAMATYEKAKASILKELKQETGLDNPNSPIAMREYLGKNEVDLPNMQAATLDQWLEDNEEHTMARVVFKYRNLSRTAPTKWAAFGKRSHKGRLRGSFIYLGASRTGRWASRGINLQNLKRPSPQSIKGINVAAIQTRSPEFIGMTAGDPVTVLSESCRTAICAGKGRALVVSDLSNIESRILGQVAVDNKLNRVFDEGRDPYRDLATSLFSCDYDEVTREQRNLSKPPALGCGYGLGPKGLVGYAKQYRIDMEEDAAEAAVHAFRSRYPKVPEFWYAIISACKDATMHGREHDVNGLQVLIAGEFMKIKLPSGRSIYYHKPKIQDTLTPWGEVRPAFTYMGFDRFAHKWTRVSAHGGGVCENIVQGIARDVLMEALQNFDENAPKGWKIVGHVHDEILVECPEKNGPECLELLDECLQASPCWMPHIVLQSHGSVAKRYWK